ncbi:MAG: tetratricopeptide repeat-containing glycosyltransferase family protein [Tepidisphaeraceae bacterium]|jgi:tetratricopeptide (TPR) repeat protein
MAALSVDQAIRLAQQLQSARKLAEAENIYRQILALAPNNVAVLNFLGICLGDADRLPEARDVFQRAVEIDPSHIDAWSNLSLACERLEDWDRAIAVRRRIIQMRPDSAEHWHRLGTCLGKKGDLPRAIDGLRKSLQLDPNVPGAHHDLVMALCRDNQLEAAEETAFNPIRATGTVNAETVRVLADGLKAAGRFEDATDVWRRAVEADPLCTEARGQWAMCLISLGDYPNGWLQYESRWDCETFSDNVRRDVRRQWGMEPAGRPDVAGKTILLYSEQGIGDTIQFVRYADLFARRGARIIVHGPWPLKSLLEKSAGVRLAYALTEELPSYDWHIPMMSLPLVFGTTVQTIPAEIPYLRVDPSRRKSWLARIEAATPSGTKLRVGLAWAGNPKHKNDANRSIHPQLFSPLAQAQNVAFFNLQKSNDNQKSEIAPPLPRLIDLTPSLHDFAETAALIEHLDLVISADTAVVHLAGALGKPVWTLLPFVPDFRWGLRGTQTPWYPTMRLYRQRSVGNWPAVIDEVISDLRKLGGD